MRAKRCDPRVVVEVFGELVRSLRSYQGRSRFGTWLLGIAHHRACRARRRLGRARLLPLDEVASRAGADALHGDRRLDAARTLARCGDALRQRGTPGQWTTFWLFYGEGRSSAEVARALCRSPQAVRVQICRTRRALRATTPGLAEVIESD
jgi:RNA polymerase sigma factor (sigma-70 family)